MAANIDEHIIIHPSRHKKEQSLPANGLLLVNPSEASECLERLKDEEGGKSRFLFNSKLVVTEDPQFFAAGPAIGAPMAVLTLEKLIALGAKRVILFGWCGAISKKLKVGDVLVPGGALAGEGTSRYYQVGDQEALSPSPDSELSDALVAVLTEKGIKVHRDPVWSTDAIYREDRRMLLKLHQDKGIGAIDMEYSALCTVAKFRKVEFSAVLTVSDELWGKAWRPGFSQSVFKNQKQAALEQLLAHLAGFGEK